MRILILNGPNLNLLGEREPSVYGSLSTIDILNDLKIRFSEHILDQQQSNVEGELINVLHQSIDIYDAIVFNAGGYTHTSVAIADAVAAIDIPVVEVHISNTYARESYRHVSHMAKHCAGVIIGFGTESYALAIQFLVSKKT